MIVGFRHIIKLIVINAKKGCILLEDINVNKKLKKIAKNKQFHIF
jgi:hypothetical protein